MELIEIRNNLVKLSFATNEKPTLGHFISLAGDDISYIAQIVNIKSDKTSNNAIARLIFTYNNEGVVNEYDGSIPAISSELSELSSEELLSLLPIETPIKIGQLAQQDYTLNLDVSIFENNFTIFTDHNDEKETIISNLVIQLFKMKEKSIIIDTSSLFENNPSLKLGIDFKIPLNPEMIDCIFNYELKGVEPSTKAVILDIFDIVKQYVNTLDGKFIPLDSLINVVSQQYQETNMPELALLKTKLLKYNEMEIFANKKEDFSILNDKINQNNCLIINLCVIENDLQKEVITYIHKILESTGKYVYFFVPVDDDNTDKKLLRRLINHDSIFTTILASHTYKYVKELKENAQNILLFAPMTSVHDFASYNTFLAKMNPQEAIMYGKLTQYIPFIVNIEDLDLGITKEDVFGNSEGFMPELQQVLEKENSIENKKEPEFEENIENETEEQQDEEIQTDEDIEDNTLDQNSNQETNVDEDTLLEPQIPSDEITEDKPLEIDLSDENSDIQEITDIQEENNEEIRTQEDEIETNLENNEFFDELVENNEKLTEDDLDYIENSQILDQEDEDLTTIEDFESFEQEGEEDLSVLDEFESYAEEETPVVPIYKPEEDNMNINNTEFSQGDKVNHPRYGNGIVEKVIKYGNKTLCSITFDNVGRRLLDSTISDLKKI